MSKIPRCLKIPRNKQMSLGTDHLTCRGRLWFFVSFRIFFPDNTRVRIFIYFVENLTLGYMTKTLNQIMFSFLHQNQNIFFNNIGNQNIFLENTIDTLQHQYIFHFPEIDIEEYNRIHHLSLHPFTCYTVYFHDYNYSIFPFR